METGGAKIGPMERPQNPDPFETERVGHPERPNQSPVVDILEWYYLNIIAARRKIGGGWATLYDVVGSVKRHVECTSCGRLVLVLT
jgi:hypothetical protein